MSKLAAPTLSSSKKFETFFLEMNRRSSFLHLSRNRREMKNHSNKTSKCSSSWLLQRCFFSNAISSMLRKKWARAFSWAFDRRLFWSKSDEALWASIVTSIYEFPKPRCRTFERESLFIFQIWPVWSTSWRIKFLKSRDRCAFTAIKAAPPTFATFVC